MQKVEYGDLNKFLVSIGLVLIGLAILTPYFYLKEDFGIMVSNAELYSLQEPVKQIILDKQQKVVFIQCLIKWVSPILALLGLGSLIYGLIRWFERQKKLDDRFDKEVLFLDLQIENQSATDKLESINEELDEINFENQAEPNETKRKVFRKYINAENRIAEVFKNYSSKNFRIYNNIRFDKKFDVDILLRAKSSKFSDRIIEVKYFSSVIQENILESALQRLERTSNHYIKATGNKLVPIFIVVYNQQELNQNIIADAKKVISNFTKNIVAFKRLKVEFIEENSISQFDVRNVLKK